MARFLALDWDYQQLHVVAATVGRHGVQLQRAVLWAEDKSPNPAEAEDLGRLLRERLKTAGIAPAPVLVCVGRDRLILKDVRYPAVPAAEEPAVVRFQAVKELTDSVEEVVIDYTAVGETASGDRRALALIVRRELLNTYQTLCKGAGLKLVAVAPRPLSAVSCLQHLAGKAQQTPRPEPPDATVAVVTVTERWAEFCVVRGAQLMLARSMAAGKTLVGEIRRNVSVYSGQAPSEPVRALYVAGNGDEAGLRQHLQELLGLPVHSLDPFAGSIGPELPVAHRGGFVGPVGVLQAWASREPLPINFVAPKQPKPPQDPNRKRILAGAAAAALLLVGTVAFCYSVLAQRDRKMEYLAGVRNDLDRLLVQIEEDAKRISALDEWSQKDIVWLDELYDLTERFPDPKAIRLTMLNALPLTQTGKDKHVAHMSLKGITTENIEAMDTLMRRLQEDQEFYNVDPVTTSSNLTGADRFRGFRLQFTTGVELEKRPPQKYLRQLDPSTLEEAAGRNRSGRPGDSSADLGGGGPP